MLRSKLCLRPLLVACVAGCAQPQGAPPNAQGSAAAPRHVSEGVILSMRKVTAETSQESWRRVLLVDAGTRGSENGAKALPLVEFIVRTDAGSTLSIVQANDLDLRSGDRVVILRDDGTRLARPG